jgi:hypothetical protein
MPLSPDFPDLDVYVRAAFSPSRPLLSMPAAPYAVLSWPSQDVVLWCVTTNLILNFLLRKSSARRR